MSYEPPKYTSSLLYSTVNYFKVDIFSFLFVFWLIFYIDCSYQFWNIIEKYSSLYLLLSVLSSQSSVSLHHNTGSIRIILTWLCSRVVAVFPHLVLLLSSLQVSVVCVSQWNLIQKYMSF